MNVTTRTASQALPGFAISKPSAAGVRELRVESTVFARLYLPDHPSELTKDTDPLCLWIGVSLVGNAHVCEPDVTDAITNLLVESAIGAHFGIADIEGLAQDLTAQAFPALRYRPNPNPAWRIL